MSEEKATVISESQLPEDVQKQISALRQLTSCHNILTRARHAYEDFQQTALAVAFLTSLHNDLCEEVLKCPEAENVPDLKPLFDRKRKAEEFKAASVKAQEAQEEKKEVTPLTVVQGE
ncbi:MAG: hypothetical protein HC838_00075 [Spirulinaceae cyanobacterium RM2_2_10]|nr:hypothetical protein [Spirulinaceae cyanobacterium RM2_2_10]